MTTYVWPTDIVAHRCDFRMQYNNTQFVSPITKTRQVLKRSGDRWMAEMAFRLSRANAQRVEAIIAKLRGIYNTVTIWDMAKKGPLGTNLDRSSIATTYFNTPGSPGGITKFLESGSPTMRTGFSGGAAGVRVYGGWAIGATQVLADGFPANTTQLLAGDYVEFSGALYMLQEDAEANGLGRAYLYLNRGLVVAVAHRTAITRTRARATMQLVDDDQGSRPRQVNGAWEFNLSFVEDLLAIEG